MTKTFTYDDVVRYLYAETTESENELIVEALALDDNLMKFYLDSLDLRSQMDKLTRIPPDRAINKIFKYSQQFSSFRKTEALFF